MKARFTYDMKPESRIIKISGILLLVFSAILLFGALPAWAGKLDKVLNSDDIRSTVSQDTFLKGEADVAYENSNNQGKKKHEKKKHKEDEILVKFKSGTPDTVRRSLHDQYGSTLLHEFSSVDVHLVRVKGGLSAEEAVEIYRKDLNVDYAEPNFILTVQATPNDPRFPELWGLHNTGQTGGTTGADIHAPEAWNITKGSSDVVVAVIDTGIDLTHPDLAANAWVNTGEKPDNNLDDDGDGYVDDVYGINFFDNNGNPIDDNGHGTHVAGTIGAVGNNGFGVAGVNWNVKIMACKFMGSGGVGFASDAIKCLDYMRKLKDKGVNIVATNNSWGGEDYSQTLYDAIKAQKDILFIAAAGNNSESNDLVPYYPASYNLPNIIAVPATDQNDSKASFSNYGKQTVHAGAPGVGILSTIPNNDYASYSGTSMAAPYVTGLTALLKAQDPGRSWIDIKNLILAGGDDIAVLGTKTITGKRINAYGSLSCVNKPVFAALQYPQIAKTGVPVILSALSINCKSPVGPVTVTTDSGQIITLRDDGNASDVAAGDGIFTATWTPSKDAHVLTFSSAAGTVIVPSLGIATRYLPEGNIHFYYNQSLEAINGTPPYTWSIVSGSLPDGLSLNAVTGAILGNPATAGAFSFTVNVKDTTNRTATEILSIRIADDYIVESWGKTYDGGNKDYANDLAVDGSGNVYVTGSSFNPANSTFDFLTLKYDTSGKLIWSKTYDSGKSDSAEAIAVDKSGNVYVAGGNHFLNSSPGFITIKYDPNGNVLWTRAYDDGVSSHDENARAVAVDVNGNVYVTGYILKPGFKYDILTLKYNSAGSLIWTKTYSTADLNRAFGIAIDKDGNIYLAGDTASLAADGSSYTYQFLTLKYDPSGNVLWNRTYDGLGARGVAVDGSGDVYVAGWGTTADLIKYGPSGALLWAQAVMTSGSNAYGEGLAIDGSGNIDVMGSYYNGSSWAYFISKYDPSGSVIWTKLIDGEYWNSARGIAVDGNNNIYAARTFNSGLSRDYLTSKYTEMQLLAIGTQTLPSGMLGASYSRTLTASGGKTPYTWSITSGSLPDGLILDSSTGAISGIPAAEGMFAFTVQVSDAVSNTSAKTLSITIYAPLTVSTSSLFPGSIGAAYSQTLAATGGTLPYSWSIISGSLPGGLTLDSSTGVISGTPTTAGTVSFTVQASDANSTIAAKALSIVVYDSLTVTTSSLSAGTIGAAYNQTLAAIGGVTPYTWSLTAGSLPAGLTLNSSTGVISGTPTVSGTVNFTVQASDTNSTRAEKALSITLYQSLTVITSSLPAGTVGASYNQTLTAAGGATPYTWSIVSGSLPAGLTLNSSTGVLSGTPTAAGTVNVTVQVADANSVTAAQTLSVSVYELLVVTTSSLPSGITNVPYSQALTAAGGTPPYTWSVIAGSLPNGLALDKATGAISGTPTTSGAFTVTTQVTDANSLKAEKALSISVYEVLVIATSSLSSGVVNTAYSESLAATGGKTPYAWSILSGNLPNGLALDKTTGAISGTPTTSGAFAITVQVTDANSATAAKALSITIHDSLTVTTSSLSPGTVGAAYSQTLAAIGGVTPYAWSITAGSLPAGLTLNSSTGVISGTPASSGTINFTVQVTDANSAKATNALSITVHQSLIVVTRSLPSGTVGASYSQVLTAAGGMQPYSWSISSGSLPNGMTLNGSTGVLSGIPTSSGTASFTVQATDANSAKASQTFSLSVYEVLAVTTVALPSGIAYTAYSQSLAATGGKTPYSWSIISGSLPDGLTLNASTGIVSGTAVTTGVFNFTAQVTDANAALAVKALSITVAASTLKPDLVVSTLLVPSNAGAVITVNDVTKNNGPGPAAPSTTRFYLSTDMGLDGNDVMLGSRVIPSLAPAETNSGATSVTIPTGTAPGIYYVIAKADADDMVAETNETNNAKSSNVMRIGPDLVVSALTVPVAAGEGTSITVTDTTKNSGAGDAGPSTTSFYLSTNSTFDATAVLLGSRSAGAIVAGAGSQGTTSVLIPAGTLSGVYYIIARADDGNTVAELNENNNTLYKSITIGPDLVVSTVTVPSAAGAGTTISITDTTKNNGPGAAPASATRFYLSTNAALDATAVPLGNRSVPALAAGATSSGTTSVTIPTGTATGMYYVIAMADADNLIVEVNELNNTKLSGPIKIGPDLIVSAMTVPSTAGAGTSITVTDTTKNSGAGDAGPSTTSFYLSTNSTFDATAVLLGSRSAGAIVAGAGSQGTTPVLIPAGTLSGAYYIIAKADDGNTVAELNIDNNTLYKNILIGPDLTVTTVTVPTAGGAGTTITISDTTKNNGPGAAPASTTRFYLSTNTALDANAVALGSRSVAALAAGATSSGTTSVTVPSSTPTGTYYVIAKADADDLIVEVNELNNTKISGLIKIGPDLIVSAMTVPSTAGAGTSITVTDTTKNSGAGDAGPSTTSFYLSTNSTFDATAVLLGSRSAGAIVAGAGSQGTTPVLIPAGTLSGAHYIIAKADDGNTVAELNEDNNTLYKTITIGPDLVVFTVTVPSAGGAGTTITINDTTKNNGPGSATASVTKFYLSTDTSLDSTDIMLGSRPVPVLAAGATSSGTTSVTIPTGTATGMYYVIAMADADNLLVEINEANNTKLSGLIKIGPDLMVSTLTVPSTAGAGTSITVTDTTKNSGAGDAGLSTTSFYLSTNSTLDASAVLLGSRSAGAIVAGASSQGTTSVPIPAGTLSGAYYIIAKADDGNTVAELNEDNNTLYKTITIGSDLVVSTVAVPSAAGAGTTISITDTTKNNGPGAAPASATRFYLSTNTALDATAVPLGDRSVPVLAAGATSSGTTSATIPTGTTTGMYYVIAKADADDLIAEINEANNTKLSGLIKIGPDLTVSTVNAPSTAGAGTSITVTDTTKNSGAGDAGPSTTSFYLSTNSAFDASAVLLGSRPVGAIAAGATDQSSTTVNIPTGTTAGMYYIISKADANNVVAEIFEDNNTYIRPIKIGP